MVDISSQNNKINVTVSSSGNTANTNVTPDSAMYYSNKSKEWAISDRIVDNTDYSSKYYANESKKQADISTAKATEVVESGNTALTNIDMAKDNAIIDITNQESLSVDNVNTAGATQVSNVNTAGITQVTNVNSAGATQINLAKEQVTLATNQANIATEQATIATNKTSEVVASGNTALSNIDTAKNNAITSITTQETTSKNNVIATGNEQVERVIATGNNYDNLTHKNITNCLLEVPQRIKYTLENGTLTIKAGSVFIVPYGTEDKTAQYPKGATFLNDNFKVYDTQYADGKFFAWAELQNDYVCSTSSTTSYIASVFFRMDTATWDFTLSTSAYSGDTEPSGVGVGTFWYDTANNLINKKNSSGFVQYNCSLPFMRVDRSGNVINSVTQVFNGIGYIGSTVWIDKGVKGLAPNRRNADGMLNNIEVTTNNVLTRTIPDNLSIARTLFLNPTNTGLFIPLSSQVVYDEINNITVNNSTGERYYSPQLATFDTTNGVISNFKLKQPFRAVDYNDVSNTPHIIDTYVNDTSGYILYSNKYCVQFGRSKGNGTVVKLIKAYQNTNYAISCTTGANDYYPANYYNQTVNGFTIKQWQSNNGGAGNYPVSWITFGYIA